MENTQENYKRLLAQEELILEVTEAICTFMMENNITRKELADRLGRSKGFVSQLLNGGRNLTLRTLADVSEALDAIPMVKIAAKLDRNETSKIIWRNNVGDWRSRKRRDMRGGTVSHSKVDDVPYGEDDSLRCRVAG